MENERDSFRLHLRFNPKNSNHMQVYRFLDDKNNKIKVITMALLEFMDNHSDEEMEKMIKKFKNQTISNKKTNKVIGEDVPVIKKDSEVDKNTLNEASPKVLKPKEFISANNTEKDILKNAEHKNVENISENIKNIELTQDEENDLLDSLDMFE